MSTSSASFKDKDDDSLSGTSEEIQSSRTEESRDEVKEMQKSTRSDTLRVQLTRVAATIALLITAFAVTFATYRFLKRVEKSNFETAFEQFSRTVGDAAVGQQKDLRNGVTAWSDFMSTFAKGTNQTWPFIYVPGYEVYAHDFLKEAHCEMASFFPKVRPDQREQYEKFATENVQNWIWESHMIQKGNFDRLVDIDGNKSYHPYISRPVAPGQFDPEIERNDYYLPSWHLSPPPSSYGLVNWNMQSTDDYAATLPGIHKLKNETLCTRVRKYVGVPVAMTEEEHAKMHSELRDSSLENPHSFCFTPIHRDATDTDSDIVGIMGIATAWDEALLGLLPDNVKGITSVLKNNCNQSYTYVIEGGDAIFLGEGDQHEEQFDHMEVVIPLSIYTHADFPSTEGHCMYSMHIYPSTEFKQAYDDNTPEIFAGVVAVTFVVVALFFFMYDTMQQQRNDNLIHKAAQSNAIVTNLIPEHLRNRLSQEAEEKQAHKQQNKLKAFMNDGKDRSSQSGKPLADLYLDCTIIFADISGFTAWSSVREPTQVFVLLETLYAQFDAVAKKRRVFKVETVGDCYVAVCGLPDPRKDHAVAMARFGRDIIGKMQTVTKQLEITLGPDTGDLALRVGMHSGPVTAGVLRGERARFQLFGDTVNVCERIEASGMRGRIHCSKETAACLKEAGKESWLEKRSNQIVAKGKGSLTTYWITVKGDRGSVASASASGPCENQTDEIYGPKLPGVSDKTYRLINWNVEMLLQIMKQIVARRNATFSSAPRPSKQKRKPLSEVDLGAAETPLEEVREIITLPEFDEKVVKKQQDPSTVEIPSAVSIQLHALVSKIATMYRDNPFHNFEHASHVVMSVIKLMSRIVAPTNLDQMKSKKGLSSLHDHTYGITSDPLTQFSCAFSALIHDVDHQGISNAQIVKEGQQLATQYKGRSIAEQNSLDLSWNLLFQDEYKELKDFLFATDADLTRFRQLVVNSVMATDIVDKDLKELRNKRWDKAFKEGHGHVDDDPRDEVNRKATVVIEHIIQASDISHTMQHWHVYRQWNKNLFEELYVAYLNGRMEKNPADFWYKGEFGFFDFYIIPLTRKLKSCGVFGVSSDEYLNYALKNREEWELKGEEVVAELIFECERKYGVKKEDKIQEQEVDV